jgi:serine-type D-Ala-D-Ala carboxypeptidase/endopeptidase
MRIGLGSWIGLLALSTVVGRGLCAQSKPSPAGDYAGVLAGVLHIRLHISAAADGALSGTLDSIDQGANGLPCADFQFDGSALSFRVPIVNGTWKGTFSGDGSTLAGTWSQGSPMPLNFTRDTFVPAEKPSAIDGTWLGSVQAGGRTLRAKIQLKSDRAAREFCTFDSVDQRVLGLECTNVKLDGTDFSFEVPQLHGRWKGRLSEDHQTLTGSWTEGGTYALHFSKQAAPVQPPAPTDAALPPVKAADLQAVLDRDLEGARVPIFRPGALSEGTGAGVAIGVVEHGVRRVFTFGAAKPDSIFEIGSISKTFTALLLARMVAEGKVKFDDPVRELLPPGTVAKPEGAEITLLDLATQHSGLPRMPDNFHPADPSNPYADYHAAELYHFLASHGVGRPPAPEFLYSNLGFGLLGQALANRAGISYAALLEREIAGPLALKDTVVSLSPDHQARFLPGHDAEHRPAHAWDLDALAGAGAIRSTAGDMLTYLEAQLHPEKFPPLSAAIAQTHDLRADSMPGMRIGLAWLYVSKQGFYWHNGGTGGFSSYAFFDPKNDCAGIVLVNTALGAQGSFADLLGAHVRQRLTGEAPASLAVGM